MAPPLALGALAVGLAAHVTLLARLRRAEPAKPWWFGYARDGANLSAALMLWGGYLLADATMPVGLTLAFSTVLATYLCDWLVARWWGGARGRLLLVIPLVAWLVVVAFAHHSIDAALARLIAANQPS